MKTRKQTLKEESINAFTHGLGVLFTLVSMPFLLDKASETGNISSYYATLIFGFGMLAVYTSSSLYHWVRQLDWKEKLHVCDHVSIFLIIGGTYAPFVVHYTDTFTAKIFLSCQWFVIIVGGILKLFFTGKYDKASLIAYILLGWSVVFLIKPFSTNMPFEVFQWVLAGGLSYTVGVLFYRWDSQKYAHAIWHLFVLGGTVMHYVAAWKMYG